MNETVQKVLQRQTPLICKQLVQSEVRQYLFARGLLTDTECEELLSDDNKANLRLLLMIRKKGTTVFYEFLDILKCTKDECPGHIDIIDALTGDIEELFN